MVNLIRLIGTEGSTEYTAALEIQAALISLWPEIESSSSDEDLVLITVGQPISGYATKELDIVILANFKTPKYFRPTSYLKDKDNKKIENSNVIYVENFVAVIEEKSHPPDKVNINGNVVSVLYKNGWHSATDQNMKQMHSLREYFLDNKSELWMFKCLYMSGLKFLNILGVVEPGVKGNKFLTAIASENKISKNSRGDYSIRSGKAEDLKFASTASIFRQAKPTTLDRKKMDAIVKSSEHVHQIRANINNRFTLLRGAGGTGKTIALLQAAWAEYKENGTRTLLLTYNHSLAADISRLMNLLGVPSDSETGGITIRTAMSFFSTWLFRLEITNKEDFDESYNQYETHCAEAIETIQKEALTQTDIKDKKQENFSELDFDFIIVDEGQDWPKEEAQLLKLLYDVTNICVADGVQQLIRGEKYNWLNMVPSSIREVIHINRSLRLKSNLSHFLKKVSDANNIPLHLEINNLAPGGKILVLKKSYEEYPQLHEDCVKTAKKDGNSEIDFLFCVNPTNIFRDEGVKTSSISKFLNDIGDEVWNGLEANTRKNYPKNKSTFRVLQYQSCRGLEGWTVVLNGFDTFMNIKYQERIDQGLIENNDPAFESLEEIANTYAWRWGLIALSRPIDTLILQLDDVDSNFSKQIIAIANSFPDFVDFVD